jgi:hypothetical protein
MDEPKSFFLAQPEASEARSQKYLVGKWIGSVFRRGTQLAFLNDIRRAFAVLIQGVF